MREELSLEKLDIAKRTLREARDAGDFPTLRKIRNQAEAVRVFKLAQKHRDESLEAINYAAEIKLRSERFMGEMIAETGRNRGRPGKRSAEATIFQSLEELGVSKDHSSEWQKIARIPNEKFESAIAATKDAGQEITTAGALRVAKGQAMAPHFSSQEHDWSTPDELFALLKKEFRFRLDVCASKWNAKCERFYSKKDDGLAQTWRGVCWMNPPYGNEISAWVRKAHASAQKSSTLVCLLPARVDTAWWWDYVITGEIRFLKGRLAFTRRGQDSTTAPFPSAIVVFKKGIRRRVIWWDWGNV